MTTTEIRSRPEAHEAPTDDSPSSPRGSKSLVSVKIEDRHRQRLAAVYVWQSSPHQVAVHRESRELQYGLTALAERYGWPPDRILVIDDDQGHSARRPDCRGGFDHLLTEVTMDHVGIVLGLDMSQGLRTSVVYGSRIALSPC